MITVELDGCEEKAKRKITPFSSIPCGEAFFAVECGDAKERRRLWIKSKGVGGKAFCFNLSPELYPPFANRWSDNQGDFYDYEPVDLKICVVKK